MNASVADAKALALVAETFVRTGACVQALEAFTMLMRIAGPVGGMCLLTIGESGMGKTTMLTMFAKGFQAVRTPEGWVRPALRVAVPTSPTAISLMEEFLVAMGDPQPSRGTRPQKKNRLLKMLRAQGVLVLLLDELHHFVDRESERILFDASEALKEILSSYPMAVACAGLADSEQVVRSNEQLKRRHMRTVTLSRFDWRKDKSKAEFRGLLRGFAGSLKDFDKPELASEEMGLRFFLATGGITDFVMKILVGAVDLCLRSRKKVITLDTLSKAWRTCLHHAEKQEDPFAKVPLEATTERLDRAAAINQPPPRPARRRGHRGGRLASVGL